MKLVVLELSYRILYLLLSLFLFYCFSYFNQGVQLEYFSGLFVNEYQAIDFNCDENIRHELNNMLNFLIEEKQHISQNVFQTSSASQNKKTLIEMVNPCKGSEMTGIIVYTDFLKPRFFFLGMGGELQGDIQNLKSSLNNESFLEFANQNESKTWAYLFVSSLTYFYCLQLNVTYTNGFVVRNMLSYFCLIFCIQFTALIAPGLLKQQRGYCNLVHLLTAVTVLSLIGNQNLFFMLINSIYELTLEPLDSELQIGFK